MTDQYDWSKLDEGWKHERDEVIVTHQYAYWYHTGCVAPFTFQAHDPEAAYQFHVAAREQVAKCRVPDWEARCKELERALWVAENNYAHAAAERDELAKQVRGSVHDSRDWQRLTEENEQLRAKLAAPDVDTGIWVCAKLRRHAEDTWLADKRCSYDDAVEWLLAHGTSACIFPVAAWNALVRSGRAR
jgi:hypothetical protein